MNHKVVAVAYDRLCTFEFGCAVELFALPRPELPVAWYDFAVCAAERGPIRATGGVELTVPHTLRLLDSADTLKNGIGHSDRAGWDSLQKALVDVDLLKEPVDLDKVYSNKFLPQPKS